MSCRAATVSGTRTAGSSRGSHGNGGRGLVVEQQTKFLEVIDVVGKDCMPKELWIEVKGRRILAHPEGKRCAFCPFKDNSWCPLGIASGTKRYIRWGKPPNNEGKAKGVSAHFA